MKKKILILSLEYFPYVGGAEVAIREVCKRLPEFEFTLITCWNDKKLAREEVIDNVKVVRVGLGIKGLDKYIMTIPALLKVLRLNRKEKFDMTWGVMANPATLTNLFFKLLYPKTPYLLTTQEGHTEEKIRRRTFFWSPLYKAIYKSADHIHSISNYLAKRAWQFGYQGSITIIPNGVDIDKFTQSFSDQEKMELKNKLGIKEGEKVVITTSRLEPKNGVIDLVEGFALLKNKTELSLKLLILGEGSERSKIEKVIKNNKLEDAVILTGFVNQKEVPKYLSISDVFIRPSLSEGLGNSFLEAMAASLPVIATPVGGIPDFLIDEVNGLFCQPGNPQSIADSLLKMFNDTRLSERVIQNGRTMVVQEYNWELLSEQMGILFNKLLNKKILLVAGIFPPDIGGPATYTKKIAEELTERGSLVSVICYANESKDSFNPYYIKRIFRYRSRLARYGVYLWNLIGLMKKNDIVYCQGPVSSGFPCALASLVTGKEFFLKIVGDPSWEMARNRKIASNYIDEFQKRKNFPFITRVMRMVQKFVCRRSKIIIVPSLYLKSIVKQWGIKDDKIKVIYNATNLPVIDKKELSDRQIILSVGRLVNWKGFDQLIDLMAQLIKESPKLLLLIVGDGPLKNDLQNRINDLDLNNNIKLIGKVSKNKVFQYMRASDIFVLNTSYEGLPHIVLESMAARLPVIITRVGGNVEVIKDGENGFLYNLGDTDDLRKKIELLLSDKNLAKRLSNTAYSDVRQYSWNNNLKQLMEIISSQEQYIKNG
jgi:glycosyltransferase involved in cell wall biosynthesis